MTLSRLLPLRLFIFAFLLSVFSLAWADSLQDVNRSIKQGRNAQALEQVNKHLAGAPKDPQGRFLKGLILTELNRSDEAIVVFKALTEDYPELPEPYNNMAVIYAQQNQYEKAKQALESALRTDPAYATAHENLGDIYIRMASQAYDKALQTNSANAAQPAKLAMIRQLADARPTPPDRPTQTLAMAEPKPVEVPQSKPAVASQPEPKAVEPASAKPAEPKPAQVADNAIAEATAMVHAWAAAWSKKDVKAYLAFYAKDFRTPNDQSRSQWEKDRAQRINKPGVIAVVIANLSVKQNGPDQATAYFRQHYQSASLNTLSNKALTLVRHNGRWLILQEQVGK